MTDLLNDNATLVSQSPLERIKRIDTDGKEFWSGRDLRPILGYAAWQRIDPAFQDVYSSLCLENPSQTEITPSFANVEIGSGAVRRVEDWQVSRLALDRILSRIASHKPEAVRELRRRSNARFRIEIEIGAVLLDFCEHAGLPIEHQKKLGNHKFDFFIDNQLLVEIDEEHHKTNPNQMKKDQLKNALATQYGYKLLRITIPVDNIAKLCGLIVRMLNAK